MLSKIKTVAFNGLEILDVELQTQISAGLPSFTIVGLPDKTVAESKERVRAAFFSMGISFPPKRITINLTPADLQKEGSHFDLPLALGLLVSMGIVPKEKIAPYIVLGEIGLDGNIVDVNGVLPVAVKVAKQNGAIICPHNQGSEAVWADVKNIIAPQNLLELINHLKGDISIPQPQARKNNPKECLLDMKDIKGQESAKRAMEIAAAGGHNVIMVGPPGSGKSMLASRLPSILPPMSTNEAIEASMVHSIAGELKNGYLNFERPYRDPHHSASTPSLVGGGRKARPGEISLAHNGVLFLDELPEFSKSSLEALRQPLENGYVSVSRVLSHVTFPSKFQLIAAMNPCRCGHYGNELMACSRAPKCVEEYQSKISGPLLDRIDIQIEVPAINAWDMAGIKTGESSKEIQQRVINARKIQKQRFEDAGIHNKLVNAELQGDLLDKVTLMDEDAKSLLIAYADKANLSARGYHRTLRLARTIADLQNEKKLLRIHIAEALSMRWKRFEFKI